jgi:hypothetical protein
MGIFNDIFSTPKPKVTPKEFQKVRGELAARGISPLHRDRIESIFSGDMYEKTTANDSTGIMKDEIDSRIKWLKENKHKHGLSDKEIQVTEESLRKKL